MHLYAIRDGEEHAALVLGPVVRHLGRAPDNDLVLDDPTVSSHHASLWVEDGRAWLRDRGSRNGTFVDDERVRLTELHDGARIRLGAVQLVARGAAQPTAGFRAWLLEDVDAGVRYPFRAGRLVLGAGDAADVRLDVPDDDELALLVQPDGEVWRDGMAGEGPLTPDEVLAVGGRRFRVVEASLDAARTFDLGATGLDYRLEVTLEGVSGPQAVLVDPGSGNRHIVDAENRAVLLYLLARAAKEPAQGADPEGWCADDDVSVGIWGRKGTGDANSLHVLVHRLRKELKRAGFEPWFLEKRRKAIRLALQDVVLR